MSFWDVFWWFFGAFAFVACICALVAVFADLFGDQVLSGWWKAIWIFFLMFVPFLTVLVYLIVRGSGMADRALEGAGFRRGAASSGRRGETSTAKPLQDFGTVNLR